MKRLLITGVAICLVVFLASSGFAAEKYLMKNYGPAGPGGRVQHVSGSFVRDLSKDNPLVPMGYIAELKQLCMVVTANVAVSGDVNGENPILSDVFCMNDTNTLGRDEAVGWLKGRFKGETIYMLGRMTIEIDLSSGTYTGYWIFQEGAGTHYGVFILEGQVAYPMSTGTYSGWVRKNK